MDETRTAGDPSRAFSPDTANAMPSSLGQGVPAVLLVEEMERAAARAMWRDLAPGESSVSISMSLRQFAAIRSQPETWRVTARRYQVCGRVHEFKIEVVDASGPIASGSHRRAVVVPQRLQAIARRRVGLPAMMLHV